MVNGLPEKLDEGQTIGVSSMSTTPLTRPSGTLSPPGERGRKVLPLFVFGAFPRTIIAVWRAELVPVGKLVCVLNWWWPDRRRAAEDWDFVP